MFTFEQNINLLSNIVPGDICPRYNCPGYIFLVVFFLYFCHTGLQLGFRIQAGLWWEPEWDLKSDLTDRPPHPLYTSYEAEILCATWIFIKNNIKGILNIHPGNICPGEIGRQLSFLHLSRWYFFWILYIFWNQFLPHSAPTWILNQSWALMRARVGSKIRFDQPTTHPPNRLLNVNMLLHNLGSWY